MAKRSWQLRPPLMKPTEKAMVSVDELGRQLSEARLTRSDALERISSVSERLNEEAKTLGENPAFVEEENTITDLLDIAHVV